MDILSQQSTSCKLVLQFLAFETIFIVKSSLCSDLLRNWPYSKLVVFIAILLSRRQHFWQYFFKNSTIIR